MKEIKLTKKQEIVLNYIKEYTAKHGFPPAVREIAKGVGLNSPSSVHSHIKRLERDGFIKKTSSKFRTLEVVGKNEFKTDDSKAVELNIYSDTTLKKQKETILYPASRIPKNTEIFGLKISKNTNEFQKDDILIIVKPKNYRKYDIVIKKENDQIIKETIDKSINDIDESIIGKLIELTRFY